MTIMEKTTTTTGLPWLKLTFYSTVVNQGYQHNVTNTSTDRKGTGMALPAVILMKWALSPDNSYCKQADQDSKFVFVVIIVSSLRQDSISNVLCRQGWPWTPNPPAFTSRAPGLLKCGMPIYAGPTASAEAAVPDVPTFLGQIKGSPKLSFYFCDKVLCMTDWSWICYVAQDGL